MKKSILTLLPYIFALNINAQIVTDIYTVQQDTSLLGLEVRVLGIVTAGTGIYDLKLTFIEDQNGGPYSGVAVWDASGNFFAEQGDKVIITGKVAESGGMTQILVRNFYISNKNNPLPAIEHLNTSVISSDSSTADQYESVLIQVDSVLVVDDSLGDGQWLVDDGSGACRIGAEADNFTYNVPEIGTEISSITGILNFDSNNYKVEPRHRSDIADGDSSEIYTISQVQQNVALLGQTVTVEGIVTVATGVFNSHRTFIEDPGGGIYSGILLYDSTAALNAIEGDELRVTGMVLDNEGMTEIVITDFEILSTDNPLPEIEMVMARDFAFNAQNVELYEAVLVRINDVYLSANNLDDGEWEVNDVAGACDGLKGFCRIGNDAENLIYEIPTIGTPYNSITGILIQNGKYYKLEPRYRSDIIEGKTVPIGDTLTIIQRPLINIPSILQPGDTLDILCDVSESPSSWSATLIREDHEIELSELDQDFDDEKDLWTLKAVLPNNLVSEMYDLKLEIPGETTDISEHAVQVISEFKDDFYFIHITDTHLPTNNYCRDDNYQQDSSEVLDLREVMKDINIINPAFVLHTGDLIHEGELEDYLHNRYYTKSKRILGELDVPLYLVTGNHDIGGWNTTPMSDGSARRNWWKFFGWKFLNNPSGINPKYTQDYTFTYGNCHFIGMESYLNYDWWRSDIYGGASFIDQQLLWLEQKLNLMDESMLKILFYHFDFNSDLNLEELGIDLALWGHTHHDSGELDAKPLNISTQACSNGLRAYRLIRVKGDSILPVPTLHAGQNGNNLNVEFHPANNGLNYQVSATIQNNLNERFEHGLLKFIMPADIRNPGVTGGTILQVDDSGQSTVFYIGVDIKDNSTQTVTLNTLSASGGPGASTCTIDERFVEPGLDTLNIRAQIINPDNFRIEVKSIIEAFDQSNADTVLMFDDGAHNDSIAGDGLFGGHWPVSGGEQNYNIHISTFSVDSGYYNVLSDAAYFTTIGPVKFDSLIVAQKNGNRYRVRLLLQNSGSTATASNVHADLVIDDDRIKIEDNHRFFGDISAGQTAQSNSFYNFITQYPAENFDVQVLVSSNDTLFWTDSFTLLLALSDISGEEIAVPGKFILKQNYPNPFNPSTSIEFSLPKRERVTLKVYNLVGQEVATLVDGQLAPGNHVYVWDASDSPSGIYYYRIEAGTESHTQKLVLIK